MEQALKETNNLLVTLLSKEFSSDNLESIFKVCFKELLLHYMLEVNFTAKHLEPWIQSANENERTRAMESFVEMLRAYLAHSESDEAARSLPLQGQILGRMVPRCSDPKLFIRQTAVDCIQMTLRIATCSTGSVHSKSQTASKNKNACKKSSLT